MKDSADLAVDTLESPELIEETGVCRHIGEIAEAIVGRLRGQIAGDATDRATRGKEKTPRETDDVGEPTRHRSVRLFGQRAGLPVEEPMAKALAERDQHLLGGASLIPSIAGRDLEGFDIIAEQPSCHVSRVAAHVADGAMMVEPNFGVVAGLSDVTNLGTPSLTQAIDVERAHAAAFRAASDMANSSVDAQPLAANSAHLSAGMRLRAIQERTVWTETSHHMATVSGAPDALTISE